MKNLYQNWTIGGSGYAVLQDKQIVENTRFNKDSVIEDDQIIEENSSIYEWVDLGLPSGLLWASTNVGAEKPEDFGLYFAWGETQGYEDATIDKQFAWEDYKWCNDSYTTLTKYNNDSSYGTIDKLTTLELVDDAAYVSDNSCRMPTKADFEELIANTTITQESLNGVNGRRFTSKIDGNSIFIPAAGDQDYGSVYDAGSGGYLWSSSLAESASISGWCLHFNSVNMGVGHGFDRYSGLTIRAVKNIN